MSNYASDSDKTPSKSELLANSFEVANIKHEKRHIPSASSALIIGGILGIIQAAFLISAAKPLLNFMGVKSVSRTVFLISVV